MKEAGRVPYVKGLNDIKAAEKRPDIGTPVQPQETPKNGEYEKRLRRQRQIFKSLRNRRNREEE